MLTKEEKKKITDKLKKNQTRKVVPSNIVELGIYLNTTRQSIYQTFKSNRCPIVEEKLKDWSRKNKSSLTINENKIEELEKYGFKKIGKQYATTMFKSGKTEYFYLINENYELELKIKGNQGVFKNNIANFDIIFDLISEGILKKTN